MKSDANPGAGDADEINLYWYTLEFKAFGIAATVVMAYAGIFAVYVLAKLDTRTLMCR